MAEKLNDSPAPALLWSCLHRAWGLKIKGGKNSTELTQNELTGRRLVTQRGITQRNDSTGPGNFQEESGGLRGELRE